MYSTDDSKNLASIKSRMGWQVGLQAGTLLAIGNLNSSVQNQTEIISSELQDIKSVNIEGFQDVETALNSLESSLISGFEDLKWFLGSIDDKLARIIGLVEFPKSTESSEQYLFGMELFKQKYFEKAIVSFNSAVEKNPLNLNAKVGLYLATKERDKKEDLQILEEIIHLTDSNFTLNLDVSDQAKNNSIIFFSNFVFNELSRLEKYDTILDYFENHLVTIAKQELNIRIRYLASKINKNIDYDLDLRAIIEDGDLMSLLCFIEYKKDENFINFLLKCSRILDESFSKYNALIFSNTDEIAVKRTASLIVDALKDEKQLMQLASVKRTLAFKHSILNNFFEKAQESTNLYEVEKLKLGTSKFSINKLKKNKEIVFEKEENKFLAKSNQIIQKEINKTINKFKKESLNTLTESVKTQKALMANLTDNYPALEDEEQYSYNSIVIIMKSLGQWNSSEISTPKSFSLGDIFKEIESESELASAQEELSNIINDLVKKVGKLETVKLVKKRLKIGLKEAKEYVDKYTT
tara:strand:- start:743 stop:2314 length:1572 start_codon:yes stop_codon:yes gene_type:complete